MENKNDNSLEQNTNNLLGTTVLIETEGTDKGSSGGGSGFFIAPDKIVTNVHVLDDCATVTVKSPKTEKVYTVEGIIAFDDINDLAILKIVEKDTPFSLGDSSMVQKGDRLNLIGYPKGKANRVEGNVDKIRNSGKHLWLKFMHSVGPGCSGGPVLNPKGEVVAVAQSGDAPTEKSTPISAKTIASKVLKPLLEETKEVEPLDVWQKRPRIRAYVEARKGYSCQVQGEYKKAISHYDTALQLNPELSDVYIHRGTSYSSLAKNDGALADFFASLRRKPEKFSLSGFGVFFLWKLRFVKLYLKRISHLLANILLGAAKWLAIQGRLEFSVGKMRSEQGSITETRNHYRKGINFFTESINRKPKIAKRYYERGQSKYLFGKFETEQVNLADAQRLFKETVSDMDEAFRLELKNVKLRSATYHTRAVAKDAIGDHNGALQDFNESISLNPNKALSYHDRGLAKDALEQYKDAIKDFDKAIELKLATALTYFNRGVTHKKLGLYTEAIKDFNRVIELNPSSTNGHYERGLVKELLGESDDAKNDFKKVLKVNPNIAEGYHEVGLAKCKLHLYKEAIADFDKTVKLKPEYYRGYLCRGCTKQALGQDEASKADFDVAIKLNPKIAAAYKNRGVAKRRLGNYEQALKDLNEAIRLKPKDGKTYIARGNAYKELNQLPEADADFAKAKDLKSKLETCF